MTLVIDASAVAAGLLDDGDVGAWAEDLFLRSHLVAPHLLPVETADTLRKAALTGVISPDRASRAHSRMLDLPIDLMPYAPVAARTWQLRDNVRPYDGWYVSLAELLGVPLATIDQRLVRSPGPRCSFSTPASR